MDDAHYILVKNFINNTTFFEWDPATYNSYFNKIKDARPVYPPIAQSARVSGVVIIEATIGTDGRVKDAKVLRSIPLLDQAALDAVKQWQYSPTLLNGVPVSVIMTVTVNFTLQ